MIAAAWQHIVRYFRGSKRLLGYDLFNEPWPGSQAGSCASTQGCPPGGFDQTKLTDFFIAKYSQRYNRPAHVLSDDLRAHFLTYDWPGNVRELENMIKRFVILQDEQLVMRELSKPRLVANPPPPEPSTPAYHAPGAPAAAPPPSYAAPAPPVAGPHFPSRRPLYRPGRRGSHGRGLAALGRHGGRLAA